MATVEEVNDFLREVKRITRDGDLHFVPRDSSLSDLATLGILPHHAEDVVMALTPDNYSKGPEDDRNNSSGAVWVFGYMFGQTLLYIKLKLDNGRARCLSFHAAESPLQYPLRTS